jgi:hypothetical protein
VAGRLNCRQAPAPEELLDDEDDPLLEDDDDEPDDDELPLDDEDEPMPEDELLELLLLLPLLPELPLLLLPLLLLLLLLLPLLLLPLLLVLLSTTDVAAEPPPPQPVSSRIARESAPYRAILVTKLVPSIRQFPARAALMGSFIWRRSSLHVTRVLYLIMSSCVASSRSPFDSTQPSQNADVESVERQCNDAWDCGRERRS